MSPRRRHRSIVLLAAAGWCVASTPECLAQKKAQINPFSVQSQTYAALDTSGTSTGGSSVSLLALDDNNQAAFAYTVNPGTATNGICVSEVWKGGSLSVVADF